MMCYMQLELALKLPLVRLCSVSAGSQSLTQTHLQSATEAHWPDPAMLTLLLMCTQEEQQPAPDLIEDLLADRVRSVEYAGGHTVVDAPRGGRVYLPGSFNPLHDGHRYALYQARSLEATSAA